MFALLNNDCFQTGAQESINLKNFIKGIVHLKMKILSSFTLPSCRSKTVLLLCGTQNNVFLRKLATKWFWVPLTSIEKNTMGFNETKFLKTTSFVWVDCPLIYVFINCWPSEMRLVCAVSHQRNSKRKTKLCLANREVTIWRLQRSEATWESFKSTSDRNPPTH